MLVPYTCVVYHIVTSNQSGLLTCDVHRSLLHWHGSNYCNVSYCNIANQTKRWYPTDIVLLPSDLRTPSLWHKKMDFNTSVWPKTSTVIHHRVSNLDDNWFLLAWRTRSQFISREKQCGWMYVVIYYLPRPTDKPHQLSSLTVQSFFQRWRRSIYVTKEIEGYWLLYQTQLCYNDAWRRIEMNDRDVHRWSILPIVVVKL